MDTPAYSRPLLATRPLRLSRLFHFIYIPMPRRSTVCTIALCLGGLSVPVLMILGILPVTFLLGLIGFALTITGGIMALVFCGEI